MLFDKSLMKKSKSVKSACGKKKSVKAAVDGGWEVPDHLAHEAYDLAEEYFGTEDINQQIVDALSDTELAENLAFIFRMNDFREWDDYLEENYPENEDDEDDDDIEESVRAKRKRAVKASKSIKASVESGYTEDLSDFGMREIELLRDILDAWINNGLPDDFEYSGVKPAFNTRSGYVFLVNDEYQVAMEVDGVLESFYTTPYEGYEGFYEDLLDEADNSWNYEDLEYLRDIAENRGDSDGADKLTALMAENSDDDIEESVRAKRKRAVRASKKSVKRFKVNASTGKVSYKRRNMRNKVTAAVDGGSVTLKGMNTDVVPVADFGCYGGPLSYALEDVFVYDALGNIGPDHEYYDEIMQLVEEKYDGVPEFFEQVLRYAPGTIQEAFNDYDIPATVVNDSCKWYHPREYNFGDDVIEFDMTIDTNWVESKFRELSENSEFTKFINREFSSRDGFISFMPNDTSEYETLLDPNNGEYWKVVSAIIKFIVNEDPSIRNSVTEDLYESLTENADYTKFSSFDIF